MNKWWHSQAGNRWWISQQAIDEQEKALTSYKQRKSEMSAGSKKEQIRGGTHFLVSRDKARKWLADNEWGK